VIADVLKVFVLLAITLALGRRVGFRAGYKLGAEHMAEEAIRVAMAAPDKRASEREIRERARRLESEPW